MKSWSKYRAIKTVYDGITFDSKKEAMRYQGLKTLLKAEIIKDLKLQERFDIIINGIKICFYKCDFSYTIVKTGERIVEDIKGYKQGAAYKMFRLKKKLVEASFGIEITEI